MAEITGAANGEKSQIDFKEITSFIVEELSKRNLLRKGATTYQNTESLLYKYNDLKKSVEDREELLMNHNMVIVKFHLYPSIFKEHI